MLLFFKCIIPVFTDHKEAITIGTQATIFRTEANASLNQERISLSWKLYTIHPRDPDSVLNRRTTDRMAAAGTTPDMMMVVKVQGDGDCLFHALAFHESGDGGALRIDVAEFMTQEAYAQEGFEAEWLSEAKKLREYEWGGHTAITAYSLMKMIRVVVHTHDRNSNATTIEETSHSQVRHLTDAPVAHIVYNGHDHYDALVPLLDSAGLALAWHQPLPATYFSEGQAVTPFSGEGDNGSCNPPDQTPAANTTTGRPRRNERNSGNHRKRSKRQTLPSQGQGAEKADAGTATAHAPALRHRRYAYKTAPPPELQDDILTEMSRISVSTKSKHPHRKCEDLMQDTADGQHQVSSNLSIGMLQQHVVRQRIQPCTRIFFVNDGYMRCYTCI